MSSKKTTNQAVEDVAAVEESKSVNEEVNDTRVEQDNTQPEPKTMDYEARVSLTPQFLNDLVACLGEMPYVQSEGFIRFAHQNKDDILLADLNEFINKLQTLPWKYVHALLQNIGTQEGRTAYFVVKKPQTDEQ